MKKQSLLIKLSRLFLCVFLMLVVFPGISEAASVRGRVEHMDARGRHTTVPGVAVTVSQPGRGRSYPVYTDARGMYYLQNIRAGIYNLEIWRAGSSRPVTYRIRVNEPYTDISPVTI